MPKTKDIELKITVEGAELLDRAIAYTSRQLDLLGRRANHQRAIYSTVTCLQCGGLLNGPTLQHLTYEPWKDQQAGRTVVIWPYPARQPWPPRRRDDLADSVDALKRALQDAIELPLQRAVAWIIQRRLEAPLGMRKPWDDR